MDRDKTRMRGTVHLLSVGLLAASTVSLAQALVFGWQDAARTLGAETYVYWPRFGSTDGEPGIGRPNHRV